MPVESLSLEVVKTVIVAGVSGVVGAMAKHAVNIVKDIKAERAKDKEHFEKALDELKEDINTRRAEALDRIHALETKMAEEYERRKSTPAPRRKSS